MNYDQPNTLKTASLFVSLPPGHVRVMIARGPLPKGLNWQTLRYAALTPQWDPKDTPAAVIQRHYLNRLAGLDPEFIFDDIARMAGRRIPVLCGYASARNIATGAVGCHRHLAAQWFERALDIQVEELGAPKLDRFKFWNAHPVTRAPAQERPRTGPYLAPKPPRSTKATRAARALAQYKFPF